MQKLNILMILIIFFALIGLSSNWKTDRRPRIYGDNVHNGMLSTKLKRIQKRLVVLHDYFRTKVVPPASNMLNMEWHKGAARAAQRWAESCKFLTHDSPKGRRQENYGSCGQNIFVSTHKVPWLFALKSWFIERANFTYGSNNNILKDIGHYTQMVWSSSHKVGCGIAKCNVGSHGKSYINYVCNYCPGGNYQDRVGFPYKAGGWCKSCPHNCHQNKKLCTNVCHTIDFWSNCNDLHRTSAGWLCDINSSEGLDRRRKCGATCTCKGKIHD